MKISYNKNKKEKETSTKLNIEFSAAETIKILTVASGILAGLSPVISAIAKYILSLN